MVLAFDKTRSERLNMSYNRIKTHPRRRALPTLLSSIPGISDFHIRAVGRWSLAVLAFYVSLTDKTLIDFQNRALKKARQHFLIHFTTPKYVYILILPFYNPSSTSSQLRNLAKSSGIT